MIYRSPNADSMERVLEMIAGEALSVQDQPAFDESSLAHQAIYTNDNDAIVATCDCDLPAAVALGCSLSMIPSAGIEKMLSSKSLSAAAAANFYEVMNILSGLLLDDTTPHLRLNKVISENFIQVDVNPMGSACMSLEMGKCAGSLRFKYA